MTGQPLPDPERLHPPELKDWFSRQTPRYQLILRQAAVEYASLSQETPEWGLRTLAGINKAYREA